jgi:PBP1b-binding outer membrane lipoprotein LpoB
MKHITILFVGTALAAVLGCSNTNINSPHGPSVTELRPGERGFVAGLTISEKMARGILGADPIAKAEGKPVVVLEPINNDTRFPIDKDIFLMLIRDKLLEHAASKITFVAREHMDKLEKERDLKLSGQVTGGEKITGNKFKGADFILTGTFKGISGRGNSGASDYVLYSFQLIDPDTSEIVWGGNHQIKKQGKDDVTYR